jgi:hypothetical protein
MTTTTTTPTTGELFALDPAGARHAELTSRH